MICKEKEIHIFVNLNFTKGGVHNFRGRFRVTSLGYDLSPQFAIPEQSDELSLCGEVQMRVRDVCSKVDLECLCGRER